MSKLMSMFSGSRPILEFDDNQIQCCVTEISGSDSSDETAVQLINNELEYKVHA